MAQHGAWLVSDVGHDVRCQMWGVDVGRVGSTALQGRAPQSLQLGLNGAGCWVSSDGPPSKRRGGARQGMWGACLPLRSRGNTCAPAPARPSPLACPYALAATRAPLYLHAHPHLLAPTRSQQHVRPCTCTPIPTCLPLRARCNTCAPVPARPSPLACPYALAATRAPLYLHAHPHLLARAPRAHVLEHCARALVPTRSSTAPRAGDLHERAGRHRQPQEGVRALRLPGRLVGCPDWWRLQLLRQLLRPIRIPGCLELSTAPPQQPHLHISPIMEPHPHLMRPWVH